MGGRQLPFAPMRLQLPSMHTHSLFGMVNAAFVLAMNQDAMAFLAWIWAHNPVIVVLLAGIPVLFSLVVIDTHRCRKKEHRSQSVKNRHP